MVDDGRRTRRRQMRQFAMSAWAISICQCHGVCLWYVMLVFCWTVMLSTVVCIQVVEKTSLFLAANQRCRSNWFWIGLFELFLLFLADTDDGLTFSQTGNHR